MCEHSHARRGLPAAHSPGSIVTKATMVAHRTVARWRRPVAFVNGDSHLHWLKVAVDPRTREVFSYQPQIVPANRVAATAP
jgi:hypothetical protein